MKHQKMPWASPGASRPSGTARREVAAMRVRRGGAPRTFCVVVVLALAGCAPASPTPSKGAEAGGGVAPAPKQGGSLTYAMSRDITRKGLDPNVGGGQPDIVLWTQLFDTLLYQDPRD